LKSITANHPSEIIVVDGGSSDSTLNIARKYADRIYVDGGRGKSLARMIGALRATQPILAYVDSDVIIPPGSLEVMSSELGFGDCVAVSALLAPKQHEGLSYWTRAGYWQDGFTRTRIGDNGLATACCVIRRETVLSYGFELHYGGGLDDRDLSKRLLADGKKMKLSKIVCAHDKNTDFRTFVKYHFHLGQVGKGYLEKYGLEEITRFPLGVALFWVLFALTRAKLIFVPYFFVRGIVESLGFFSFIH
jgi:glycosyltransferase involved in cell wall biosynthesis